MSSVSLIKDDYVDINIHDISEEELACYAEMMNEEIKQFSAHKSVSFIIGNVKITLFS
jgi:hypothetical protein